MGTDIQRAVGETQFAEVSVSLRKPFWRRAWAVVLTSVSGALLYSVASVFVSDEFPRHWPPRVTDDFWLHVGGTCVIMIAMAAYAFWGAFSLWRRPPAVPPKIGEPAAGGNAG